MLANSTGPELMPGAFGMSSCKPISLSGVITCSGVADSSVSINMRCDMKSGFGSTYGVLFTNESYQSTNLNWPDNSAGSGAGLMMCAGRTTVGLTATSAETVSVLVMI